MTMINARIDVSQGLDGEPVVMALFDLGDEEIAGSAHAVRAISRERFGNASMSVDDVLELRELTALADDLADLAARQGMSTIVLRPARLSAYRNALTLFVETRDEADWIREEDRTPLSTTRELLWPLGDLAADALRAALEPGSSPHHC